MWSPQRILFLIFFVTCEVSCELTCTVSYANHNFTEGDFRFAQKLPADDTGKPGDVIAVFESYNVFGINYNYNTSYINAELKDNQIIITYGDEFPDYEEKEVSDTILRDIKLICTKSLILRIKVSITDTNNKIPKFNLENYKYKLPMPWPAGIDILFNFGEIWVYDADLLSSLTFLTEGNASKLFTVSQVYITNQTLPGENYIKPYYNYKLGVVKAIDVKDPITLTLVADDGLHNSTATVTIERSSGMSLPPSPNFGLPLYTVVLEEVEAGTTLSPKEGTITLENSNDVSSVTFFNGDEDFNKNFNIQFDQNGVNIKIKNEFDLPESRFGILTLKVETEGAARPGYTVVHIAFPPIICPTTTSTTEATTTTTTTTVAPTTTTTESPTCAPCPPCTTTSTTPEVPCPTTAIEVITTTESTTCATCPPITTCPDVTCPDVTCPNVTCPDVTCPDATCPDVTCPDVTCPDVTSPDATRPDVTCPDVTCPDVTCPDMTCPDATCPDVTCPDVTCPDVTCPDVTCPDVSCPTTTIEVTMTPECDWTTESTAEKTTTTDGDVVSNPTKGTTVSTETTCPPCGSDSTTDPDRNSTTTSTQTTNAITGSSTSKETDPDCCECSSTTTESSFSKYSSSTPNANNGSTPPTQDNSTTNSPTPPSGHLKFPVPLYVKTARVGDIGFITRIAAESASSVPIDPKYIEYGIEKNVHDDFVNRALKIIDGDLISSEPMEPGYHNFTATANIKGDDEQVTVPVFLNAPIVDICDNGTGIEVIFPNPFMNINVYEEEKYSQITPPVNLPNSLSCYFNKIKEVPSLGKFMPNKNGSIGMDEIDREDAIFGGVSIPEILVTLSIKCVKHNYGPLYSEYNDEEDSWSTGEMVILVHVNDKNDNEPQFIQEEMILGYPIESIAQLELPRHLGVAVASDPDVGENATIKYYVVGTDEVIIDETSGTLYPHPEHFQYKDFNFSITASDPKYSSSASVELKILSSKYLSEIRIEGKHLDNVDKILADLSESTGYLVGLVSSHMVTTGKTMSKPPIPSPNKDTLRSLSYLFPETIQGKSEGDNNETEIKDDTFCLRLVVYAFDGKEPVDALGFQSAVSNAGVNLIITEYMPPDSSGSDGLTAAVISLSVILGLIVLSAIAFVFYRWRRRMTKDNDSLEAGLVDNNSHMSNSENRLADDFDKSSISAGNTEKDESKQELDDANTERRKSVAFAEEPQVIPSEEDDEGDVKM